MRRIDSRTKRWLRNVGGVEEFWAQGDARHRPPFPLAIFSSGFLVESRQYQSYADRLASWGYVVLTYDKVENVTSNRNDVVTACFIKDLIDWAASSAALGPITDTSRVLLCGHSRGGKVRASHRLCLRR